MHTKKCMLVGFPSRKKKISTQICIWRKISPFWTENNSKGNTTSIENKNEKKIKNKIECLTEHKIIITKEDHED